MPPDPMIPSSNDNLPAGGVPPQLPASQPPVIGATPPLAGGSLPPVASEPTPKPSHGRQFVAFLLSVCLGLFLADAVISLLDDSLIRMALR